MRFLYQISLLFATAVAAVPYQQYMLAPPSRTLRPVSVRLQNGSASSATALLERHIALGKGLTLDTFKSSVTYDFGKNVAGWANFNTTSSGGAVGFTFTESSLWISADASDATADAGLDAPLGFDITGARHYAAPTDRERGAFRYLTVVNLSLTDQVSISDLWVHFTAMPHWRADSLRNYTGWFNPNDEKLNRWVPTNCSVSEPR